MIYKVVQSEAEIERLESWAYRYFETSVSRNPTASYEDGIIDTLKWLFGEAKYSPADEE